MIFEDQGSHYSTVGIAILLILLILDIYVLIFLVDHKKKQQKTKHKKYPRRLLNYCNMNKKIVFS